MSASEELPEHVRAAAVAVAEAVLVQRQRGCEYKEALNGPPSPWKARTRRLAGAALTEANAAAQRALDEYERRKEEAGL